MNHNEAWLLLDEFLDGALGAEARWNVAAHLDEAENVDEQSRRFAGRQRQIENVAVLARFRDDRRDALAQEVEPRALGAAQIGDHIGAFGVLEPRATQRRLQADDGGRRRFDGRTAFARLAASPARRYPRRARKLSDRTVKGMIVRPQSY